MFTGSISVTRCPVCLPEDNWVDALVGNSLSEALEGIQNVSLALLWLT